MSTKKETKKAHPSLKEILENRPSIDEIITVPAFPETGKPFSLIVEGKNFDKELRLWVFRSAGIRGTHPTTKRLVSNKRIEAEVCTENLSGPCCAAFDREGAETSIPEALGYFRVYSPKGLEAKRQEYFQKEVYKGKV